MSPELTAALREETPAPPRELRERVALIAATPPPPRRTLTARRGLLLAAPAAAAVSLAVAVVAGVVSSSTRPTPDAPTLAPPNDEFGPARKRAASKPEAPAPAPLRAAKSAPAPTPGRAQNVATSLRVLVDDPNDLSTATQRALRTTRRLGGYLVTVDYGTPEPAEGAATLRVRIPVTRVQAAVVQFSGLGRILAQQTQIIDVQQRLDELTRQIRRAKGNKGRIGALRRERLQLSRRAAYATVDLALTTHEPKQEAAAPSRFDRAVDDATSIVTAELAIGAYALIVASPLLLLLAAGLAGGRAYRRYADQRLLERA